METEYPVVKTCALRLGNIVLPLALHYPETALYFKRCLVEPEPAVFEAGRPLVSVSSQEFRDWAAAGNAIDAFAEFCLLCQQASQYLFHYQHCLFHAAAVRWRDRAWLIAGGSGTGKSTQTQTLLGFCPDEAAVINGDKPVLECLDDGSVVVHPSPWNGKEGLRGAGAAPLGGIFFLRRGDENSVQAISPRAAAPYALLGVFQDFRSSETIQRAGSVAQHILRSCPSWLLTSRDIPDSTKLLYQTMREVFENGI